MAVAWSSAHGGFWALTRYDDIVAAAVGRRVPASDLLADLPLVQRADDGSFQLHDLWRQTLATPSLDPAAATVLAAIEAKPARKPLPCPVVRMPSEEAGGAEQLFEQHRAGQQMRPGR